MFAQLTSNFRRAGVLAFGTAAGVTTAYVASSSFKESKANAESSPALSAREYRAFPLESKTELSPNTALYRFKLPSPDSEAGLSVATCLMAQAEIDGKTVTRPYTPVSLNNTTGHLDLMVKTYPSPGGLMSRHIASLKPGDELMMKGPFKKLEYRANMKRKIGMVAGGTGITPMLQVIRQILANPYDRTEVSLIFANVTEEDILLRDELEALQYLHPNFSVYYTLDKPPVGWKQGKGFVSPEMMKAILPEPSEQTLVLVCGPKGLMDHVSGNKGPKKTQGEVGGLMKELGYTTEMTYKF